MFLNLDNVLKDTGYTVTDDEVVKAFKNLGYVSTVETNKELNHQSLDSKSKST